MFFFVYLFIYLFLFYLFLCLLHCITCMIDPYPLKNGIWGGEVVLKFHFKMPFLQSCFLNDQYSSSFHAIGKQMKIKYLRLAAEELNLTHVRLKQHMCRGHPSKHCAAIIILALSSPGANCSKYFLISAQGLLRNVTLQFHLRGWITTPGIPSKKGRIRQVGFAPPALPLYDHDCIICACVRYFAQ